LAGIYITGYLCNEKEVIHMEGVVAVDAAKNVLDLAVVVGAVNLATVFFPQFVGDSRIKAGIALLAALVLIYIPIPAQVGDIITLLFGSSGVYKGLQVVGAVKK
jgi:hypothetical protein